MRVLIILSSSEESLNAVEISAIDFISVYGREFSIGDSNLHGDNCYMYGEAADQYERMLSRLSFCGLAEVISSKLGFQYLATDSCRKLCVSLDSSFALEFGRNTELAKD